jgi:hypothetical protein
MVPKESEGIACPVCHTMNEVGWAYCQQCGSKLQQAPPHQKAEDQPTVLAQNPMLNVPVGQPTVADKQAVRPPAGQPTVVDQKAQPPPLAPQKAATEWVHSIGYKGGVACPNCNHLNLPESSFCSSCGFSLAAPKTVVMASVPARQVGKLRLIMEGGQQGDVFELKDETVIGRVSGDITFPHDSFMSRCHARIIRRGSSHILVDEGSRNGTFIRIKGEVELKPGDMILIGKQLFRFEV